MPSSHSAFTSSLAVAIGIEAGFDSALFALALGFALVVMCDAAGIRRAAESKLRSSTTSSTNCFIQAAFRRTDCVNS